VSTIISYGKLSHGSLPASIAKEVAKALP